MQHLMSRRQALSLLAGSAATALLPSIGIAEVQESTLPGKSRLSKADDDLLDDMERRACLYFVEQSGAATGQVLDRAAFYGNNGKRDPRTSASIAATGFGLTALCIGDTRGYLPRAQARAQVLRTLRFHATSLPHEHGFFYHFNHIETGKPESWSEVSSIDTALLLCGVLTARVHFSKDKEIVDLATTIYNRVDWPWLLREGNVFSMGWRPKTGFIPSNWGHYCEMMMIPLLAIASPTHPVDPAVWSAFSRPRMQYKKFIYLSGSDPLFVHQYSHAYFDFRYKRDEFANYFENSVIATRAHEQFCLDLGKPYSKDYWGISASDSRTGYQAWGGPPKIGRLDGSVVPNAAAGSLPFRPNECLRVLRYLARRGDKVWGRYGFTDALNPELDWYNADVLGIDLGIGMLMAENLRSGFVWDTFSKNPEVSLAFSKAGFRPDKLL
ncbi:hypothetical protein SAMN05443244_0161 [Terriglobus roseus]|uniref:Glycoamylase-like domain-containing protein n=1 Tax=Terriglobus roseus TaxID=392734 RepID=A0A1H4IWY2_9BACT|nr:hypothetical protein SAMN05443244_0161 [Terriglobus roseus]